MNPKLHAEMNRALDELIDDETVRVIIPTGAGESFSAGNPEGVLAEQPLKFRRACGRLNGERESDPLSPLALGEHTESVLQELGFASLVAQRIL
jgi:enoyl-CoA hydratase/carnithine racemase